MSANGGGDLRYVTVAAVIPEHDVETLIAYYDELDLSDVEEMVLRELCERYGWTKDMVLFGVALAAQARLIRERGL